MAGIPRHEAMKPLSRHHHHALVAAMNIRKALADGEVPQDVLDSLKQDVTHFWENDGNEHFREEEEILLPAYAMYASARHEEIIEMMVEHVQIRALVAAVMEGANDELFNNLQKLSEMLEAHVRREERIIFPMIEKVLPDDVLNKLAPYFHEFHTDQNE